MIDFQKGTKNLRKLNKFKRLKFTTNTLKIRFLKWPELSISQPACSH